MAVVVGAIVSGLIPNSVEASKPYVPNNSPPIEQVVESNSATFVRGGFKPDPNANQPKSNSNQSQSEGDSFKIRSKIQESKTLSKISKKVRKDREVSKGLNKAKKQLESKEFHGGRGAKKKTVFYMRAGGKARLFFRYSKTERNLVEILAESNKSEETEVINNLLANYE